MSPKLVEDLDIARHPSHDSADGIPVEVGELKPLQVPEDLAPQVLHHSLPDPGRQQRPPVLERRGEGQGQSEGDRQPGQKAVVGVRDGIVDRDFRQPRADELESRSENEHSDRYHDLSAVGPDVGEEAPHKPRIIGFAQLVFLANRAFWRQLHGEKNSMRGIRRHPPMGSAAGC
jgi:hypothetical protein